MYLRVETAKEASISLSIPPPHGHTHCLELQEAKVCGSLLVRYWQHILVLINASRCSGWQRRPELEQADWGNLSHLDRLPRFKASQLPLTKRHHLRADGGNLPTLGFHLSLALFLRHYFCGIGPSFFLSSLSRKCINRDHLTAHHEFILVGCFSIRLCKGTIKISSPLPKKGSKLDCTEVTVNSGKQHLLFPGMTHSV